MEAGKFQLIKEADYVLSRCGRFVPPVGSVVYIPKAFLLQAILPVASHQTFYKEISGDTSWCWRSISLGLSGSPPLIQAQILKPDGKFLFNSRLDLIQIAGNGSGRYLLSREVECPPGSKLQLSLDDNYLGAVVAQPVAMLLGGAYAYFLKNGIRSRSIEQEASQLPRIFAGTNQNLLAPCWMFGEGPQIPEGIKADCFTYGDGVNNVATFTVGAGEQTTAKVVIPLDYGYDFHVRRLLVEVKPDAGVSTGNFLVRVRAGSGYDLTDDYVDLARYLGSSYLAKGWDVKAGDTIEFDIVLVDATGSGNISILFFPDGEKRRAL